MKLPTKVAAERKSSIAFKSMADVPESAGACRRAALRIFHEPAVVRPRRTLCSRQATRQAAETAFSSADRHSESFNGIELHGARAKPFLDREPHQ
jgi:hypothetical protein